MDYCTVNAKATKAQVIALIHDHPTVTVDERFAKDNINLHVPATQYDAVMDWLERHVIPASMV